MTGSLVAPLRNRLYPREWHPAVAYLREVRQHVRPGCRLLDLGCGHTAPDLRSLPEGEALKVGLDLDPDLRPAAAPQVEFVRGDCGRLPFANGSFDLVTSRSVFEHLEHPEAAFREIARVLVPGGRFVLLTPNRWDYVSVASSLVPNRLHPWLVRTMTGRAEEDTYPTRYRANTLRRLRQLAAAAALEVTRLELLREHPHYLKFSSATYLVGIAIEQMVQRPVRAVRPWILGTFVRPRPAERRDSIV